MSTSVYIDGFNLYYGSLRNTSFKWLDPFKLCTHLLPTRTITTVRYFTARVTARPHDQNAPIRQDKYLSVIKTIPGVTVHEGHFVDRPTLFPQYPLAYVTPWIPDAPPQCVQVLRTEEKKTDVNLATHLLVDCFKGRFDEAIVVSNDSDLALPIEMVVREFGKSVGIINPHRRNKVSRHLEQVAPCIVRRINKSVLRACQLPDSVTLPTGATIHKPTTW